MAKRGAVQLSTTPGPLGKAGQSPVLVFLRRLFTEKPMGALGGILVLIMALSAIFANLIAAQSPLTMIPGEELMSPSLAHWLGTDNYGRDLFSRIVFGARTSITVGLGVVFIGTTLATLIGAASGYVGGRVDTYVQRLVDAFMAIPSLVLLLTIMAVLGPGLVNVILALSATQAISQSRVVRSAVMGIKENQFVEAARALGCTETRVLFVHILPNILAPIIIIASLALGGAILAESSLSFLGYGIPPPEPTWGGMLSKEGRDFMLRAPWMAFFPGLALSLAVYGINMLGDGLRDLLDPRLRGGASRMQ